MAEPHAWRTSAPTTGRSPNYLLRSLAAGDYETLRKSMQRVEYKSGHVLYAPESPVEHIYFPEFGLVSLISIMRSGHQVESAVVGREGAVGFIEALGAGVIFSRAIVQVDLKAMRVPVRAYAEAFDNSRAFRRAIAAHIELIIAEARQTIACVSHHLLPQRLAWWILECQDRTGREELPLTHEFLSAMLGVQRTTVTTIAKGFKEKGLIDYSRGVITVLDRPGLKRLCCECYDTNAHFRQVIDLALHNS